MNCASRLVELFGSQADVARAFQLDRAVVHNWVKTGYVPARWAGEVERITQGRIRSEDVINEASAKNPVRVKSRPDDAPFGMPENDPMTQYAPSKRIHSFHPPQRTLMGPGPIAPAPQAARMPMTITSSVREFASGVMAVAAATIIAPPSITGRGPQRSAIAPAAVIDTAHIICPTAKAKLIAA